LVDLLKPNPKFFICFWLRFILFFTPNPIEIRNQSRRVDIPGTCQLDTLQSSETGLSFHLEVKRGIISANWGKSSLVPSKMLDMLEHI
jgi:hypothetical protein